MFRKNLFRTNYFSFFFESSESDRFSNYLHDSNSIFRSLGELNQRTFSATRYLLDASDEGWQVDCNGNASLGGASSASPDAEDTFLQDVLLVLGSIRQQHVSILDHVDSLLVKLGEGSGSFSHLGPAEKAVLELKWRPRCTEIEG